MQSRIKIKNRETREAIAAAITGSLDRPTALIAGLYAADRHIIVGRSTQLNATQASQLADILIPAGPDHPWPDEISAGVFGERRTVAITKIEPIVVEIAADAALSAGRFRHPVRLARVRPDLHPDDVDPLAPTS